MFSAAFAAGGVVATPAGTAGILRFGIVTGNEPAPRRDNSGDAVTRMRRGPGYSTTGASTVAI